MKMETYQAETDESKEHGEKLTIKEKRTREIYWKKCRYQNVDGGHGQRQKKVKENDLTSAIADPGSVWN